MRGRARPQSCPAVQPPQVAWRVCRSSQTSCICRDPFSPCEKVQATPLGSGVAATSRPTPAGQREARPAGLAAGCSRSRSSVSLWSFLRAPHSSPGAPWGQGKAVARPSSGVSPAPSATHRGPGLSLLEVGLGVPHRQRPTERTQGGRALSAGAPGAAAGAGTGEAGTETGRPARRSCLQSPLPERGKGAAGPCARQSCAERPAPLCL